MEAGLVRRILSRLAIFTLRKRELVSILPRLKYIRYYGIVACMCLSLFNGAMGWSVICDCDSS